MRRIPGLQRNRAQPNMDAVMDTLSQDILALVATPSETGREKDLADLLERRLRNGPAARGTALARHGDSLVLRPSRCDPERPLIVLAGHIDTVPRGEAPEAELRDGVVVGRGSSDMKAGVAVMLHLAERIPPEEGFAERAFVFYAGEEGSAASNALPMVLDSEEWLCRADLALLLEPTSGCLELGCNGSIHAGVTVRGRACHSARPWQGTHPLLHALPWIDRMLHHPIRVAEIEGVVFREVVSLTTAHAGEVRNVIPGSMDFNLNLRYPPDRAPEQAEALIQGLCAGAGGNAGNANTVILDHSPAGKIDASAPLYRYLCESTGLPRRAKQGWTDVARFTARGVPALNWGPGDPELAHTRDERVEVDSVRACLEQMRTFLVSRGPGGR